MSTPTAPAIPLADEDWKKALEELPSAEENNGKIPAFFFAHGSPLLLKESSSRGSGPFETMKATQGPNGNLYRFLQLFGPTLLRKYKPKGIVVFSAHWENSPETLVSDYGDENPLLMDYFGFPKEMYAIKFKSRGDSALSSRVVETLRKAGIQARTTPKTETRGRDGRGFEGPGLDHGVFIPFKIMFGEEFDSVPIVTVSQHQSLDPMKNWEIGKAVDALRSEGILILSGGLTVHTFQDFTAWNEKTAGVTFQSFAKAILAAAQVEDPSARQQALVALTGHPGFRPAHPREEHFTPIYIAAGAGEKGRARIVDGSYGTTSIAFGLEV